MKSIKKFIVPKVIGLTEDEKIANLRKSKVREGRMIELPIPHKVEEIKLDETKVEVPVLAIEAHQINPLGTRDRMDLGIVVTDIHEPKINELIEQVNILSKKVADLENK